MGLTYRVRVVFKMGVLANEPTGYWHAPGRMSRMVAGAVHGWVMWKGSLHDVFHSNMQRVTR